MTADRPPIAFAVLALLLAPAPAGAQATPPDEAQTVVDAATATFTYQGSGDWLWLLHWFRIDGAVAELYDVGLLPNVACRWPWASPMMK